MQLSKNDLFQLSHSAVSAACQAGSLLAAFSPQHVSVQNKKGGESLASQIVTQADHLCQEIILKTLLPTCGMFDLALLTEESTDNRMRLEKDNFWCIDPLDGTLPFVESLSGYAVSIALVSGSGSPLIGVIYDPVEQTLYHAVRGYGAFCNSKPWSFPPSSITEKNCLTIINDRSFLQQKNHVEIMEKLKHAAAGLGYDDITMIQHGGAVMNACWVLKNNPGCYFKFPKAQNGGGSLWDYSATACLFNEIGAVVCDIHGEPLDLNRPDSTFMNHRGVIYAGNKELADQIMALYKQSIK